jgi:hypothetical protein
MDWKVQDMVVMLTAVPPLVFLLGLRTSGQDRGDIGSRLPGSRGGH